MNIHKSIICYLHTANAGQSFRGVANGVLDQIPNKDNKNTYKWRLLKHGKKYKLNMREKVCDHVPSGNPRSQLGHCYIVYEVILILPSLLCLQVCIMSLGLPICT